MLIYHRKKWPSVTSVTFIVGESKFTFHINIIECIISFFNCSIYMTLSPRMLIMCYWRRFVMISSLYHLDNYKLIKQRCTHQRLQGINLSAWFCTRDFVSLFHTSRAHGESGDRKEYNGQMVWYQVNIDEYRLKIASHQIQIIDRSHWSPFFLVCVLVVAWNWIGVAPVVVNVELLAFRVGLILSIS